jgi:hypothetical protein
MRRLWHHWDRKEKPWKNLIKITDYTDRQLFFSLTVISIGNRRNTPFWERRWISGASPRELAPNLFKAARFKARSVYIELSNNN